MRLALHLPLAARGSNVAPRTRRARLVFSGAALIVLVTACQPGGGGGRSGPPSVQVVAVEAQRCPVTEQLSLVGTLTANEMVEVKAETDGIVEAILFEEGQRVEAGQLLVQLDHTKAAAALAEAEANYKLSQANYSRAKQLFEDDLISQQEFDQAAASFELNQAVIERRARELKDTRIYAAFGGIVGQRTVSPGQVISKNTTLTWLVDLDPMKVEVNVPERFLGRVQLGQRIEFPVVAHAGRRFQGEIYFISPYVETDTRTALVKARLPNPGYELKPGMLATLEVTLEVRANAVVIPEAALAQLLEGNQARVYLVDDQQTARIRTIDVGVRLPGLVEVAAGLDGGERVIVEGIQKIGPDLPVRLAPPEAAVPYLELFEATQPRPPSEVETRASDS